MNSILTAAANLATFSGGVIAKKPIRRPNINVQTASKPNKFTTSWKFSTIAFWSRFAFSNSIKSSQIVFKLGRNACKMRGLVICGVNFDRRLCQISPCLSESGWEVKWGTHWKNVSETHQRCADCTLAHLLIRDASAGIAIGSSTTVVRHYFGGRTKRVFAWIAQHFLDVLTIVQVDDRCTAGADFQYDWTVFAIEI